MAFGLLLVSGCQFTDEERLYATDSGLRTVEVVKVHQRDGKQDLTHRELRVSDKPPVKFQPIADGAPARSADLPYHPVGEPKSPETANVVNLPRASFTEEEAKAIARLLGASKVHGIDGLRLEPAANNPGPADRER